MKETYLLLIQRVDGGKERRCRKERKEMLRCSSFAKWLSTRAQQKQHERGEEERETKEKVNQVRNFFSRDFHRQFSGSIQLHKLFSLPLHTVCPQRTQSCDMFAPRVSLEMVTKWRKNDCDYELSSSWDSISLFERLTPALTAAYNTTHDQTASAAVEWERGGWGDCKKSRYSSLTVKLTGIYIYFTIPAKPLHVIAIRTRKQKNPSCAGKRKKGGEGQKQQILWDNETAIQFLPL